LSVDFSRKGGTHVSSTLSGCRDDPDQVDDPSGRRSGTPTDDLLGEELPHNPGNSEDGRVIKLQDELADGVVVDHTITAGVDEIDFQLVARNPTARASEAHWAQPCLRVDRFTGMPRGDARALQPQYIKQCFLFIDGQLTRLPTRPWADKARYTPGQVYVPKHVDRNDVNPRPLSALVPSSGLCGCFSADENRTRKSSKG
jgi:hypothetical protein